LVIHGLKHQDRAAIKGGVKNEKTVSGVLTRMKGWFDEL
jgi:hypothetical protein